MPKVKYDTNVVNEDCLPSATAAIENIQNASSKASPISFPEGDFGWGNVVTKLNDASEGINKYANWIKSIDESMKLTNQKGEENLANIKFEDINLRESIVK